MAATFEKYEILLGSSEVVLSRLENKPGSSGDLSLNRVPEHSREHVNINEVIAAFTVLREYSHEERAQLFHGKQGMYSYLRDHFAVNTLGEALEVIRSGPERIASSLVGLWVDEGLLCDRLEIEAVEEGFPELHELLMQRAFIDFDRYS